MEQNATETELNNLELKEKQKNYIKRPQRKRKFLPYIEHLPQQMIIQIVKQYTQKLRCPLMGIL